MRRKFELAIVAVVAALVGALAYYIVGAWPNSSPRSFSASSPTTFPTSFEIDGLSVRIDSDDSPLPITFQVTGSGEVDVTYFPGPDGKTTQARVRAPWQVTVQAPPHIPANTITLLAAATSDRQDTEVACRIVSADPESAGIALYEDTASGPHAVANCSASG
jgi:hypothetical protein